MIRISGRVLAVIGVAIAVCAPPPAQASRAQLTYVGGSEFPARFQFQGTTVGGLSGISYDPGRQLYYVISDDKSDHNPARFYTMRIPMIANQIGDVEFVQTSTAEVHE